MEQKQAEVCVQRRRRARTSEPTPAVSLILDHVSVRVVQTLSICRRKCAVLRRLLVHSLPSLTAYANQSGLATDTLQLDDE